MKQKVYCYYLVRDNISVEEFPATLPSIVQSESVDGKDVVLYAYTTDKNDAEMFENTRDMSLFYKKVLNLTESEFYRFSDDLTELTFYEATLMTKKKYNGIERSQKTLVYCTMYEYIKITYTKSAIIRKVFRDLTPEYISNGFLFNDNLRESLNYLLYEDILEESLMPLDDSLHFNYDEFIIDEFSLFIRLFSNTLKK